MTYNHVHFPCVFAFYPGHLTTDPGEIVADLSTQNYTRPMDRKCDGQPKGNSGEQWCVPGIQCGERPSNPVEASAGVYCTEINFLYPGATGEIEGAIGAILLW